MNVIIIKSDRCLAIGLSNVVKCYHKLNICPNNRTLNTMKMSLNFSQKHLTLNEFKFNNNSFNKLLDNSFGLNYHLMVCRGLSKGKDKEKKDKKKGIKPKVILTDDEMNEAIPINELKIELNNVIQKLRHDLISNVNVRSSPQSIENLVVDMNGLKHNLSEIVTISRKSPQLVVLNMSSMPDAIKPVLNAINESGMNLSPQQEGNVIYLPIPKVTREHREGLADNARSLHQRAKDELKDIHSSFTSYVKKQKKSHVSEDFIFNVNENIKYLIDAKLNECQQLLDQKLNDLLK